VTAELAVFNRAAVALAADSASTSVQASGLPKIFNTADKLFYLDGVNPLGHRTAKARGELVFGRALQSSCLCRKTPAKALKQAQARENFLIANSQPRDVYARAGLTSIVVCHSC
jgi:hypothetical protein